MGSRIIGTQSYTRAEHNYGGAGDRCYMMTAARSCEEGGGWERSATEVGEFETKATEAGAREAVQPEEEERQVSGGWDEESGGAEEESHGEEKRRHFCSAIACGDRWWRLAVRYSCARFDCRC
ncbi:unnamed protein product [Musa hybrid cultivar]